MAVTAPSEPIYRVLAEELRAAIRRGDYAIGAQLPTEAQLCSAKGVSRHTAREALRLLRDEGLIARRRGVGTVVTAKEGQALFAQTLGDLSDLLQYARDARLEVRLVAPIPPALGECEQLGLTRATGWARIDGLRRRAGDSLPVALTRIYVRSDLCPPSGEIADWPDALNELIARRSGVRATRIAQDIAAVSLTRVEARALETESGGPALKTIRRYYDATGEIFQASVSLHPGDRFVYTMTLDRGRH